MDFVALAQQFGIAAAVAIVLAYAYNQRTNELIKFWKERAEKAEGTVEKQSETITKQSTAQLAMIEMQNKMIEDGRARSSSSGGGRQ